MRRNRLPQNRQHYHRRRPTPLPPVALPTPGPQVPTWARDCAGWRQCTQRTGHPISDHRLCALWRYRPDRRAQRRPSMVGSCCASFTNRAGPGSPHTYVQASNAQNVPVLPAPPLAPVPTRHRTPPVATDANLDTTAIPTAPVPPTATPQPSFSLAPIRPPLTQGNCTQLSWNVENVNAVWVYPQGANYGDYPVTGVGSRQECPRSTTTYEMRVQLRMARSSFARYGRSRSRKSAAKHRVGIGIHDWDRRS